MFTDLPTLRTDVKDRLTPLLPESWKTEEYLEGTLNALVPVLYIEFVRIDTVVQGEALAPGQVGAVLNLIVTDPQTDTKKTENSADAHVLKLLQALDSFEDLIWEKAEKKRLQDGPMAWTVDVIGLVNTEPTEPTEGD